MEQVLDPDDNTNVLTAAVAASFGNDVNPWGGDYAVAKDSDDSNHLKITVSGIPTALTPQLVARFIGSGQTASSTAAGTAEIVFK